MSIFKGEDKLNELVRKQADVYVCDFCGRELEGKLVYTKPGEYCICVYCTGEVEDTRGE